eukprot:gene19215-4803_t
MPQACFTGKNLGDVIGQMGKAAATPVGCGKGLAAKPKETKVKEPGLLGAKGLKQGHIADLSAGLSSTSAPKGGKGKGPDLFSGNSTGGMHMGD